MSEQYKPVIVDSHGYPDFYGDLMLWLTYGRIPTNNWRKLHGFPLRRKSKWMNSISR